MAHRLQWCEPVTGHNALARDKLRLLSALPPSLNLHFGDTGSVEAFAV